MIDNMKKKLDVPRADVSQHLKTDKQILSYLKTAAEDINPDSIIIALNNIARIKGINNLAKNMGVSRESLYKSFDGHTKPRFETVRGALLCLGFQLTIKPLKLTIKNKS